MDRTDMLLARASQYLRSGTSRSTAVTRIPSKSEKVKDAEGEDEVEAYLKSLTINEGEDKERTSRKTNFLKSGQTTVQTSASTNLAGRGRSFLKSKDPSVDSFTRQGTVEIPLRNSQSVDDRNAENTSSQSISSPTPPILGGKRKVRAVIKHSMSDDAKSIDDDDEDAARDRLLVAEQFQAALKTTGDTAHKINADVTAKNNSMASRKSVSQVESAAYSSSFVDESGNIVYSQTFEDDDEDEDVVDNTELKSVEEEQYDEVSEEEGNGPVFTNVVQDLDELLSEPVFTDVGKNVAKDTGRVSIASIVESVSESRPASVTSIESEKYSDDFEQTSHSEATPVLKTDANVPFLQLRPAASPEPQSVKTARVVEESIATALSESEPSSGRQRAHSYGSDILKPKRKSSLKSTLKTEFPDYSKPQVTQTADSAPQQQQIPQSFQMPPQMMGNPIYVMFPPQSFIQQVVSGTSGHIKSIVQGTSVESHKLHEEVNNATLKDAKHKGVTVSEQSPSIYLPLFLERSNLRSLVSQCRLLSESFKATKEAYENRINKISHMAQSK